MNIHTNEWYLWQVLCTHAVERLIRIQLLVWVDKKMSCGQSKDHRALRCLFLYMFMHLGLYIFHANMLHVHIQTIHHETTAYKTTHNAAHAQIDVMKYQVFCGNAK